MLHRQWWAPLWAAMVIAGCGASEPIRSPDTCQYALDGECDEPEYCAEGTDTTDCGDDSCASANDNECDEPLYCAFGTDTTDCRIARLCEPQCGARVCGNDPICGKSCGRCPQNFACSVDGQCVDTSCQPQCGARVCGADPACGLSCGECSANLTCTSEGACIDTSCQPDCSGRQCGMDPVCNTSCGTCSGNDSCNSSGQCESPCSFPRITQDTQLERDVQVIFVSGQVTVNGQTMADDGVQDGQDRGYLVFTDESTGSAVQTGVGESGAATYSTPLFAGTYSVSFVADTRNDQDVLPPGQTKLLAEGVALTASGALNYDLPVITVSGAVTVNGSQMADDGVLDGQDRGYVVFTDKETGSSVLAPLGEQGAATYSTPLFAGTFDIDINCDTINDQDVLPPGQVARLSEGMGLNQSGALNFDLSVIEVTGAVTVNGNQMADDGVLDGQDRGSVLFVYEQTGSTVWAPVGESGPGIYRTRLIAGRYKIDFQADTLNDQDVLPPGASTVLNAGLDLNTSGSLGFDLPVVNLSGQITVNGGQMRDDGVLDGQDRGYLVLIDQETGSSMVAGLDESGPAVYQTTAFAGTYNVELLADTLNDQDVLPPGVSTLLQENLSLNTSGALNYDVSVVTVSGRIRLNGGEMPNDGVQDGQDRGQVLFTDVTTGQIVAAGIGESGAAIYQTPLFASTYDILLQADTANDQDVLPVGQSVVLQKAQALNASGNLDFDVRTHRLFGQITVNGGQMADDGVQDGQDRAYLNLVSKETGSVGSIPLGESGAATFDVRVFEGGYDVFLQADTRNDQDVLPPGQSIQLVVGCE